MDFKDFVVLTGIEETNLHPAQKELIEFILSNKGEVIFYAPARKVGTKRLAEILEESLKNNGIVNLGEIE